jgi:hypothetical protein
MRPKTVQCTNSQVNNWHTVQTTDLAGKHSQRQEVTITLVINLTYVKRTTYGWETDKLVYTCASTPFPCRDKYPQVTKVYHVYVECGLRRIMPETRCCWVSFKGSAGMWPADVLRRLTDNNFKYNVRIHYLYLFQLMHLFNTTLIQCQLLKKIKITPKCFDH